MDCAVKWGGGDVLLERKMKGKSNPHPLQLLFPIISYKGGGREGPSLGVGGGGAQCCECGGFEGGASLDRFVEMMGGEAVSGGGVLSCICLAPQLVCGCSTRAPLAFFLAWGGWRQRGGCAGFLCRTGQVTVRERGRGRWVCFREEGTSVKGAGSGRGGGEVRDLKSGVVGRGEGPFSPQLF